MTSSAQEARPKHTSRGPAAIRSSRRSAISRALPARGKSPGWKMGSRRQPEESRAEILTAAIAEFAEHGIGGARMSTVARAAEVNQALLYYYFKDKDSLYDAVLDHVFGGLRARLMPVLVSSLRPRQKMLKYLGAYFDYIAANPQFPRVVQGEWMRSGVKGNARMQRIAKEYFRPISGRVTELLREGIKAGEFREVDPMDFLPSVVAMIVFYFTAAPLMKTLMNTDPLSVARLRERRAFVLDFISVALFT